MQNVPATAKGSVGTAWEARRETVPRNGDKVPRNGDKVALRLCHTGWGHAGAAWAAGMAVPGQRRSGRQ